MTVVSMRARTDPIARSAGGDVRIRVRGPFKRHSARQDGRPLWQIGRWQYLEGRPRDATARTL